MKTTIKTLALVLLVASVKHSSAQSSADLFLISPQSSISKNSLGIGFDIFGNPLKIGYKKDPDLEIRFGAGFYNASLMTYSIANVPLAAPQTGNSTVSFDNRMFGCNAIARFSLPYSRKIVPYADVFAGMVGYSCFMTVEPNQTGPHGYNGTIERIANMNQYNYGVSGGLIFSLSKHFKLDMSLTSLYSVACGQVVDVRSAHIESNSVYLNKIDPPTKSLMLKVGVIFCFDKGSFRCSGSSYRSSGCRSRSYSGHSSGCHFGGGGGGGHVNFHFGSFK